MAVELNRRRFTVREFERMIRARIFGDEERVELLDGEVVAMASIGLRHSGTVLNLGDLFPKRAGSAAIVNIQNPVQLGPESRPQPDVALLRPPLERYRGRYPSAADIFLLVEVSDTTVRMDRHVKMPLYGRAAVPEAWLVNLRDDTITVYREPSPDGYRVVQTFRRGDTVAPLAFPDWAITVDEILA